MSNTFPTALQIDTALDAHKASNMPTPEHLPAIIDVIEHSIGTTPIYRACNTLPMRNKPSDQDLSTIPRLYETDEISAKNKIIHHHYFLGSCDWYMCEYSPEERLFFGYTILNNDFQNAEWGYTSLDELLDLRFNGIEVDRDLHWKPIPFSQIERIHPK